MKKTLTKAAIALCALAATTLPLAAQTDTTHAYGKVKGWRVVSIDQSGTGFVGCRAIKKERGAALWIAQRNKIWRVIVPTKQSGRFGGAIMSVDKADFDIQFGFQDGRAIRELTTTEFKSIHAGNVLGVHINGDRQHSWSLSGSAAAIIKVQECVDRKGAKPQAAAPAGKGKAVLPNMNTLLNSAHATCTSPTTGGYACTIKRFAPSAGFTEGLLVSGASPDRPAYFFNVKSSTQSQAWASFGGAAWTYMGIWVSKGRNDPCAWPRAKQGPVARRHLGQDAWKLCVRP